MKKSFWVVGMLFILLFASSTSAEEMLITLQSNSPATLPTVSEVVNIPDPTDLLNISYQATLFAFSSAGWNLAAQGTSSKIALLSPAVGWTGDCYYIDMKANLSNCYIFMMEHLPHVPLMK
jgi:hypothetical protein